MQRKRAAMPFSAGHTDTATVGWSDMLNNGKAQTRTAHLAAAGFINPVKTLKQPW